LRAEAFARLLEGDGERGYFRGLVSENGEVEVEEEEPEECGEQCEEAEAGIRVPGGGFLHLLRENARHGAPSHWTPIPTELRPLIETLNKEEKECEWRGNERIKEWRFDCVCGGLRRKEKSAEFEGTESVEISNVRWWQLSRVGASYIPPIHTSCHVSVSPKPVTRY